MTAAGNTAPLDYLPAKVADPAEYLEHLLAFDRAGITAPGTSALSLTVGGVAATFATGSYASTEPVEKSPRATRMAINYYEDRPGGWWSA